MPDYYPHRCQIHGCDKPAGNATSESYCWEHRHHRPVKFLDRLCKSVTRLNARGWRGRVVNLFWGPIVFVIMVVMILGTYVSAVFVLPFALFEWLITGTTLRADRWLAYIKDTDK